MKLRLLAALGAAVVLLSACGDSSTGSGSPATTATPAASSASPATSADPAASDPADANSTTSDSTDADSTTSDSTTSDSTTSDSTDSDSTDSDGTASEESAGAGAGSCEYLPDRAAAKDAGTPSATPSLSGEVPLTISTSVGEFSGTLDADATPCTVNSFAHLAEAGYFDDTTCHRLVTAGIFVLQCGDPSASGMGGPGYSFADELTGSETYPAGTLAMANAGPDTNGSQFFIVYADTQLSPDYTVFGSVDADTIALVEQVAEAGNAADGTAPATPVDITGVTVG